MDKYDELKRDCEQLSQEKARVDRLFHEQLFMPIHKFIWQRIRQRFFANKQSKPIE